MMQREFTVKEKVLLLILVAIILGLLYYMAVYETTTQSILDAQLRAQTAQDELVVETAKAQRMDAMQEELDALFAQGKDNVPRIPDYDNIQSLMIELNNIMAGTTNYSMSFGSVSFDESLARRPISMTFSCSSYAQAKLVTSQLAKCKYMSLIGGMSMSSAGTSLASGGVNVRMDITFYEAY